MKKLRYAYSAGGLNVLVPKQRGEGYLKQPYGHHNNPQLNEILDAASPYALNLFGLDGYLHFEVRFFSGDESRVKDIVMPLLEKHYGFETVRHFWRPAFHHFRERDCMSDRYTSIDLPGFSQGYGVARLGRRLHVEMVREIKDKAERDKAAAEAILSASPESFRVLTFVGLHAMNNVEVVKP